jgi:hypothetical protein
MLIITVGSLGALWMISRVFVARRMHGGSRDLKQLTDSVDKLRETVEGMRDELGEVTERLDFNERVLARMAEQPEPENLAASPHCGRRRPSTIPRAAAPTSPR